MFVKDFDKEKYENICRDIDKQMKEKEEAKKKGANRRQKSEGPPQGIQERRSGLERRNSRSKDEGDL